MQLSWLADDLGYLLEVEKAPRVQREAALIANHLLHTHATVIHTYKDALARLAEQATTKEL